MLNQLFLENLTKRSPKEDIPAGVFLGLQIYDIPADTEYCIISPATSAIVFLGEKGNNEISAWEKGSTEKVKNAFAVVDGTYCLSSSIAQKIRIASAMGNYEYLNSKTPYVTKGLIVLKKNWQGKLSIEKNETATYYTYVSAMSGSTITANINVPANTEAYIRPEAETGSRYQQGDHEVKSTRFEISLKDNGLDSYHYEADVSFSSDWEYLPEKVFLLEKGIYSGDSPSYGESNSPSTNPTTKDDDGLPKGAIIAIVVVVIVVVIAIVVLILWLKFCYCKKKNEEVQDAEA